MKIFFLADYDIASAGTGILCTTFYNFDVIIYKFIIKLYNMFR